MKCAKVDPNLCIGCAICTSIAANTFEIQSDGKSKAVNPSGDDEDILVQAQGSCPVGAISVEECE